MKNFDNLVINEGYLNNIDFLVVEINSLFFWIIKNLLIYLL